MLKQVSFEDLGYVDFAPQAVIRAPVAYFSIKLGYEFQNCVDDLDEYQSAFFKLEDVLPFGLIHYRGQPDDTTTIYFSRATHQELVAKVVDQILDDFGLRFNDVAWLSSGLPKDGLPVRLSRSVGSRKRVNAGSG